MSPGTPRVVHNVLDPPDHSSIVSTGYYPIKTRESDDVTWSLDLVRTANIACLTCGALIKPFRAMFSISASLVAPEERHAMLRVTAAVVVREVMFPILSEGSVQRRRRSGEVASAAAMASSTNRARFDNVLKWRCAQCKAEGSSSAQDASADL